MESQISEQLKSIFFLNVCFIYQSIYENSYWWVSLHISPNMAKEKKIIKNYDHFFIIFFPQI